MLLLVIMQAVAITTGYYNTVIGAEAGDGFDDARYNVAVGMRALSANT